ncbi:MAG: hypothetical protein ACI9DF_001662 [Verrucomicrobiales bacterium]|jgi:hypothetical protein
MRTLPVILGFAVLGAQALFAVPSARVSLSRTSDKASLSFPSQVGQSYDVQMSTDLQSWETIRSGMSGTDADLIIEDLADNAGSQFFRIVIRSAPDKTIKVSNTYTSKRAMGELDLGKDPIPFDPDAETWVATAGGGGDVIADGAFFLGGGDASFDGVEIALSGAEIALDRATIDLGGGGGVIADGGGDDFIIIDPFPLPPGEEPPIQAGAKLLTAGEWNDHEHWGEFQTFLQKHPSHFTDWQLDHQRRVVLAFVDPDSRPLHDVKVTYQNTCFDGASAKTHNDGKVAIFLSKEAAECLSQEALGLTIDVSGASYETSVSLTADDDQTWTLEVPVRKTSQARKLDLAWIVDVTGSMGDELNFVKEELIDIVDQIRDQEQIDDIRIATIFYRDRGDQYVTRAHDFTDDLSQVQDDIEGQRASGGGDFPESVNAALFQGMRELSWRDEDTVRMTFLIADAPPHYYPDEQYTYRDAVPDAHASAIKLFPVAGSGINKTTEYLFRNLAVASMGKYIFITDDSGIGGGHIDPDIEQFEVETLNAILIRTILEEYRRGL